MLRTRDDAEAYVASVCFKHGPPRLAGVELEWLRASGRHTRRPGWTARCCVPPPRATRPDPLDPGSPARALPGGSLVTVEPGGQVELASPPLAPFGTLVRTVVADSTVLHDRLAAHGLAVSPSAADAVRPARRVLDLPRYRAMEHRFDRIGACGRSGMCSTAAVQVCLDAGEKAGIGRRWDAVHALGPVLVAAFANSPVLHGRRTGWKSSRLAAWLALDPQRTAPPPRLVRRPGGGVGPPGARHRAAVRPARRRPVGRATRRHVRRLGPRRVALPGPPTVKDLDYHISTLFPPVRPRGHLEIRYVDAQPGRRWALPVGGPRRRCCPIRPRRTGHATPASPRSGGGSPPPATASPTGCCSGRPSPCSSWPCPPWRRSMRRRGWSANSPWRWSAACGGGCAPPTAPARPPDRPPQAVRHTPAAHPRPARPTSPRRHAHDRHGTRTPARRPPVRRVGHGSPAHPRRRAAGAGPHPHPRPHRRRRRGRPRRPALPADVAAGLGPRARRQPGGALAGARRRRPRAAAPRDRRALRRLPALAGQPGRAAAARPGRGPRVRGGGPRARRSTCSERSPLRGQPAGGARASPSA